MIFGLLLSGLGCRSQSAPTELSAQVKLSPQACMEELNINDLDVALQRCNEVVSNYKNNPEPLNDRSLLYILMGQTALACRDVSQALSLLDQQGQAADPMIRHELAVRQDSCKQRPNMTDRG
jgi:regulator of sirC expression with transglutaminase-like and TPR domain